jgi:alcohol dehydrogenase YqhD (iron-dependent ADH family)
MKRTLLLFLTAAVMTLPATGANADESSLVEIQLTEQQRAERYKYCSEKCPIMESECTMKCQDEWDKQHKFRGSAPTGTTQGSAVLGR